MSAFALFSFYATAQDDDSSNATSKGSWLIEVNTNTGSTGNTGFSLASVDGSTVWSAGAEAGYFIKENLAIKAGLGYADFDGANLFNYKVGAKYYVTGQFPVGVDFTGSSFDGGGSASWVGVQAGYAWFVADNVSIEPTVRYNITLDEMNALSGFQGVIGFNLFLN